MRRAPLHANHATARSAVFLAEVRGGVLVDVVSGRPGVKTGTVPVVATPAGRAITTGSGAYISFPNTLHRIGNGPFTLACLTRWDGTAASYQTPLSIENDIGLYAPGNGAPGWLQVDSGSMGTKTFSGPARVSNTFEAHAYSVDGTTTNGTLYRNGLNPGGSSGTLAYPDYGDLGSIEVGRGQGSEYFYGDIVRVALWNRAMSPGEHRAVNQLLWGGVRARRSVFYVPAAGGTTILPQMMNQGLFVGSAA